MTTPNNQAKVVVWVHWFVNLRELHSPYHVVAYIFHCVLHGDNALILVIAANHMSDLFCAC